MKKDTAPLVSNIQNINCSNRTMFVEMYMNAIIVNQKHCNVECAAILPEAGKSGMMNSVLNTMV